MSRVTPLVCGALSYESPWCWVCPNCLAAVCSWHSWQTFLDSLIRRLQAARPWSCVSSLQLQFIKYPASTVIKGALWVGAKPTPTKPEQYPRRLERLSVWYSFGQASRWHLLEKMLAVLEFLLRRFPSVNPPNPSSIFSCVHFTPAFRMTAAASDHKGTEAQSEFMSTACFEVHDHQPAEFSDQILSYLALTRCPTLLYAVYSYGWGFSC